MILADGEMIIIAFRPLSHRFETSKPLKIENYNIKSHPKLSLSLVFKPNPNNSKKFRYQCYLVS